MEEKKVFEINGKRVTNMFEFFEAMESKRTNVTLVNTGNGIECVTDEELKKRRFEEWLRAFLEEKGIDTETILEIEVDDTVFGNHFIPLEVLIDAILSTPEKEQQELKKFLIQADKRNIAIIEVFKEIAKIILQ